MTVSQTIYQQLGGQRFATMTGAHSFSGGHNALGFRLPQKKGFVKNGIAGVRIVLMPNDTYTMVFLKITEDFQIVEVAKHEFVYFDQLQEIFTNETGLYTSL